jgi:hypothetical protein
MKLRIPFLSLFVLVVVSVLTSCKPDKGEWTSLLDKDLTKWDMYLGYRLKNGFDGKRPVDEKGQTMDPIGYNRNESNVFSVDILNGEPVLHITGEIYGCVFTKEEFANYHLTLKYKWGEKKWEPRLDKLKDSGLLYHSIGECGIDYWLSWMLGQEFQIMEGHTGDYWAIENSAFDIRALLPEGSMNTVADLSRPFLPVGPGTGREGFCLRSANYESPENEWTTVELIAFEDKSIHIVNGKVVMVLKNSRYIENEEVKPLISGKIQLQSEAGEIFYKDIRIKKINGIPGEYTKLFDEK